MKTGDEQQSQNNLNQSHVLVQQEQEFLQILHEARWSDRQAIVSEHQDASPATVAKPAAPWSGIALSGGGIRSATFCLGALQALAASDLLKRFDYISSVSGGGYTAAGLQWWWNGKRAEREKAANKGDDRQRVAMFGAGPGDFPYGTDHPNPAKRQTPYRESPILSWLRQHGRYLTPGKGITIWSGIAIVLRTLVLNLFIWLPLIVAVFALAIYASDQLVLTSKTYNVLKHLPSPLTDTIIPGRWRTSCSDRVQCELRLPILFGLAIYAAYLLVGVFSIWTLVIAFLNSFRAKAGAIWPVLIASALAVLSIAAAVFVANFVNIQSGDWRGPAFIAIAALIGVGLLLFAWARLQSRGLVDASYIRARRFDRVSGWILVTTAGLLIFGLIPILPYHTASPATLIDASRAYGIIGLASGVASGVHSIFALARNVIGGAVARILAPIGAAVFMLAFLIVSYLLAMIYHVPTFIILNEVTTAVFIKTMFWFVLALAIALLFFVRVNAIGLHRFYRDRLMEAFMPSLSQGRATEISPIADKLTISDLLNIANDANYASAAPLVPFPIINTNVILINDKDLDFAERGGDSFMLTPLFIGSRATGWMKTKDFEVRNGPVTLASAMTASAAAATENAAYVGAGLTRNRMISLLMSLFNLRLGLWLANPMKSASRISWRVPNNLYAGIVCGLLGQGYRRDSHLIELSDGGHFDNLGIYELIRRRTRVILAIDGEADKETNFPALTSVMRRITKDFPGTVVRIESANGPERLMSNIKCEYPNGVLRARWPYFVAEIEYPADGGSQKDSGVLIYCKAVIVDKLSLPAKGYIAENRDFPNQSTLDQFFTPEQFESYRELGYVCMKQTIEELILERNIGSPGQVMQQYHASISRQSSPAEPSLRRGVRQPDQPVNEKTIK